MGRVIARIFLLVLLDVGLAGAAVASPESELRQLEDQRRLAISNKDFKSLAAIYAPEFLGITSNGALVGRDELFRVFERTDPTLDFRTDEVRIAFHGETAVYYGRLVGTTPAGATVFMSRFLHVFVKRDGSWVCVAGESTPIPRS